jgi:hypothetical protein
MDRRRQFVTSKFRISGMPSVYSSADEWAMNGLGYKSSTADWIAADLCFA